LIELADTNNKLKTIYILAIAAICRSEEITISYHNDKMKVRVTPMVHPLPTLTTQQEAKRNRVQAQKCLRGTGCTGYLYP
jgi:hypothetical protein